MPPPYSLHAGSATVCSCVVQLICDCYREVEGGGGSWKEWEIEGDGNIDLLPSLLSLLAPL